MSLAKRKKLISEDMDRHFRIRHEQWEDGDSTSEYYHHTRMYEYYRGQYNLIIELEKEGYE